MAFSEKVENHTAAIALGSELLVTGIFRIEVKLHELVGRVVNPWALT